MNKEDLKSLLISQDFDVVCLGDDAKTYIDLRDVQTTTRDVLANYKLLGKDDYTGYTAIGLQYEDENNPLYDANGQLFYLSDR